MTVVNRCGKLKLNFPSSEFQNLSFRILRRNFLSLSQFQPIFVLFVAISAVLDPCLKAMSLVGNYPNRVNHVSAMMTVQKWQMSFFD